jgi:hypothetical protein
VEGNPVAAGVPLGRLCRRLGQKYIDRLKAVFSEVSLEKAYGTLTGITASISTCNGASRWTTFCGIKGTSVSAAWAEEAISAGTTCIA